MEVWSLVPPALLEVPVLTALVDLGVSLAIAAAAVVASVAIVSLPVLVVPVVVIVVVVVICGRLA